MASEESKPVPPEPTHTNPIQEDENVSGGSRAFNQAWARWFTAIRSKINVINESIVTLGAFTGVGIVVKNGAQWLARTITGTVTEIVVTNGNGVAGNPNIGLADVPDTGTGALRAFNRDVKGRVTGTKAITITGTTGRVVVTNGDGVAGNPTIDLDPAILTSIGASVTAVIAGFSISVDNTNPRNPIVSVMPASVTLAAANALTGVQNGQFVLITDLTGGPEPCWYDSTVPSGTKWRRYSDRSIAT